MSSPKRILVTLATGKQGSNVVKALAERNKAGAGGQQPYEVLAVTRSAQSAGAKALGSLPGVTLLESDYIPAQIFKKATESGKKLYGVFSVQTFMVKQPNGLKGPEGEKVQGIEVADEAAKAGVEHFVYSSVDFGGLETSDIPHFESKRAIEQHIKKNCASMPTTVLRPVAFMDNLSAKTDMQSKIGNTLFTNGFKKPVQLIACSDIGKLAAKAFDEPQSYIGKTVSLAGDAADAKKIQETFKEVKGRPLPTTFGFFSSLILMLSTELRTMFRFFDESGYTVDIKETRQMLPDAKNLKQWMETEM